MDREIFAATGKVIFETNDLVLGYDKNNPLSREINLRMERGEKIALVGTNGIGKTTFLKVWNLEEYSLLEG